MIKIDLSNTIIELHLAYCRQKVELVQDIVIEQKSIDYINSKVVSMEIEGLTDRHTYTSEEITKLHNDFMLFCESKLEDIAIGKPQKLKEIINQAQSEYPLISFMFGRDEISVLLNGKSVKYSKAVLNMYKYNEFITFNSTSNNEFIYNEEDKNMIVTKIKEEAKKLSNLTINELVELLYGKWRISKSNIIRRIERDGFSVYWNAYTFAFLTDIKTCPYCNRQYITPIFHKEGRMRGDLDHFFPKDKYPYLSMSIYNLIPVCKFCNSSFKNTKEFDLNGIHPYEHSFDDYVDFKYEIRENNKIGIVFKEKDYYYEMKVDKYISMFRLEEQYNYHSNVVTDLIHKKIVYTNEYIKDFKEHFKDFDISDNRIREIIIGYEIDKENINKEPLSKLKRDIVNQLGFGNNEKNEALIEILKNIEI